MTSPQSHDPAKSDITVGRIRLGIWLVIGAALLFALGGVAIKLLSAAVPASSALVWRNLLSAGIVLPWLLLFRSTVLKTDGLKVHIARGVVTMAGLWAYFLAINLIPLSTAVVLRTASPIFVPIAAFVLLRHVSDRNAWLGSWIGLGGVALLIEPSIQVNVLGATVGVLSGLLGAVAGVLIWQLGRTESVASQTSWLLIVLGGSSLVVAPWCLTWPSPDDWPLIAVLAITTTGSQVLLSYAFKIAPADKIITWGYLSVVFGAIFDALLWSAQPTVWAVVGIGLVIAGSHVATSTAGAKRRKIA